MRTTLSALGYGAASNVQAIDARSQNLHIHINAEQIIGARERAAAAKAGGTPLKLESGSSSQRDASEAVGVDTPGANATKEPTWD
jgi:hypothetical protein